MDIRQSIVSARVSVCQPRMVDTHQVQHCRVQIVNVDAIFDRVHPQVIRCAKGRSAAYPAASHPHRKTGVMMVSSCFLRVFDLINLRIRRSPELTAPNHQRILEKPALF